MFWGVITYLELIKRCVGLFTLGDWARFLRRSGNWGSIIRNYISLTPKCSASLNGKSVRFITYNSRQSNVLDSDK